LVERARQSMMMTQAMVNLSFGRRLAGREGLFGEEDSLQAEVGTRVSSWKKRGRERRAAPYLRKRAKRPRAPDNTTQFLMGDQGGARQSFSDSDLENSSESEDHFVEREFAKDYDNLKSEIQPSRQKLPKSKLIEELMSVEKEVKMLEKKYAEMTTEEQLRARLGTTEFDIGVVEPELAQKIQAFQAEIVKMAKENRSLRLDNTRLVNEKRAAAKVQQSSSSSSSSSSSDSSSDSDSESSSESEAETTDPNPLASSPELDSWVVGSMEGLKGEEMYRDDTGYESERSTLSDRVTSSSSSHRI